MKVAIVHDWLTGRRGGEKVLESFCRLLPGADLFTLFYLPEKVGQLVAGHQVIVSWLNQLPGVGRYYRYLLPLAPAAVEGFDLRGYDLVLSSSHAVAKGVRVPAGVPHLCYCHTPMRYLWDTSADYFQFGPLRRLRKLLLGAWQGNLRKWDLRSSHGVMQFLANSENVRQRIWKLYGRHSVVLHPPVDTEFFTPGPGNPTSTGRYFLVVAALEPYKRVDLAIRAMNRLGKRLVVAGSGSQARALRRIAGPNVKFTGWVSDERLRELYRACRALLFPGLEDFGIVPLEAQACGKPVVAYGHGGALETILPGRTGIFFSEQTESSLAAAVAALEDLDFDADAARRNSLQFSRLRFESALRLFLTKVTKMSEQESADYAEPEPRRV